MLSRRRIQLLLYTYLIVHTVKSFQIPYIFQTNNKFLAHKPNTKPSVEDANVVVIVPGFMTGSEDFQPLARSLSKRGIPAAVVPMSIWHWIPCMGGQCMRPMLDRIDYTVQHVCSAVAKDSAMINEVEEIRVSEYKYNVLDCLRDLIENLGRAMNHEEEEYPIDVKTSGNFAFSMVSSADKVKASENESSSQVRICLVGHSAGGWISRMYLSDRPYFGKSYSGTKFVHSLITLGTPHMEASGPAFNGIKWCNRERLPVRGVAVGGVGSPADSSGDLTRHSYAFCGANETEIIDGDGVTPVSSALALEGDDVERIKLHGVTHYPWSNTGLLGELFMPDLSKEHKRGKRWYGDDEIVDHWAGFLKNEQK